MHMAEKTALALIQGKTWLGILLTAPTTSSRLTSSWTRNVTKIEMSRLVKANPSVTLSPKLFDVRYQRKTQQ